MGIIHEKVAIITVTYNCSDFIEAYLLSVQPIITRAEYSLVVIDNNSTDNTNQLITKHIQKHSLEDCITFMGSKDNIGFGRGCNLGVDIAKKHNPTYLWFLNPDTTILYNSGDTLLSLLKNGKNIDFSGSILSNEKNEFRPGAFRFPCLTNVFLSTLRLGVLDRLLHKFTTAAPIKTKPYQADWLTGASFMTSLACFEQLGGFDPKYFLYFEEVDLFYRAKKYGFSAWSCPSSHVFHISGASTGINRSKMQKKRQPAYWFESRRHFYTKNYGRLYFTLIDICHIVCLLIWKARAIAQNKTDDTPSLFISDIIRHSYPAHLIKRMF